MEVPFVDLKVQYHNISKEIQARLLQTLESCRFILGPAVDQFEQEFADFCAVKYAVGLSSGTDALFLSLLSLGVGPGDEVITAANTYIATALAIDYTGARVVLVDMDQASYNLDVDKLKPALTKKTKVILPVHLYGQPADMAPLLKLAEKNNLKVVEDACQAHGAEYKGKRAGSFGQVNAFSFYPGKNLGAYGDAGMAVTNDAKIKNKLLMLRDYGQKQKYQHLIKGFNARLDTVQAEILRVKLKSLSQWNDARRRNAKLYNSLLKGVDGVSLPDQILGVKPVWHLYVIRTAKRDQLQKYLKQAGVDTGRHYPTPIHLQPAFSDLGYKPGEFPVTERAAGEILSLPMYPELKSEQIEYVAQKIKDFFNHE
ncbi:DegT/DnrJ/EryC1/StrS family aminotransferase [Candidatus Omnitrophota bacterium]